MKYQRIELADGTVKYRCQPRDPVTKRRMNIEADTLDELRERLKRVKQVRDEMRWNGLALPGAVEALKPVQRTGPYTVAALWEDYLKVIPERSLKNHKQNWQHRLKRHFGTKAPHELTREVMMAWERELQREGYAPKTIAGSYASIAGCIRLAVGRGDLRELPWGGFSKNFGGSGWRPAKAKPKRERQAVGSIDQFLVLVEAAQSEDKEHWARGEFSDYAVKLAVLMLTGMRQAEACALGWDCVDIDQEPFVLTVRFQAQRAWHRQKGAGDRPKQPTKTDQVRKQLLHPTAVRVLKIQRAELQKRGWYRFDGPVFPGKSGEWRTSGRCLIPAKVKGWAAKAGLPFPEDWVVHSTRHSFATLEVRTSGDLKRTQARTGHADVRQLEGYLHATGAYLGATAVPDIPLRLEPIHEAPDGTEYVDLDPLGIERLPAPPLLETLGTNEAMAAELRERDEKRKLRAGSERKFRDIAQEWFAQPERLRSGVPREVSEAASRAYCRAYSAAKRQGLSIDECRKSARRKKKALLGAWGREWSLAKKAAEAQKAPEPLLNT